jgi:transaldolase
LGELEASTEPLPRKLWPEMGGCSEPKIDLTADSYDLFKKLHGEDEMAVTKLAEGIQGFSKDQAQLESMVAKLVSK